MKKHSNVHRSATNVVMMAQKGKISISDGTKTLDSLTLASQTLHDLFAVETAREALTLLSKIVE